MTILQQQRQLESMHEQGGQPQSPFSVDLSRTPNTCCSFVFETPVSLEDKEVQTSLTPPPIRTKTQRHDVAAITSEMEMSKYVLPRQKRLRPRDLRANALPPMIPGTPELYNISDSNPFRTHIPIHSPIVGMGNKLNIEYIGTIGATKSCHGSQLQRDSASSKKLKATSSFHALFPVLEDSLDNDVISIGDENEHKGFGIPRRVLKIRRRYVNHNHD